MVSQERKHIHKRGRRCIASALIVLATMMVEMDTSMAFSPFSSSDSAPKKMDARKGQRVVQPSSAFADEGHSRRPTGTDLQVVLSPQRSGIYPISVVEKLDKLSSHPPSSTKSNTKQHENLKKRPLRKAAKNVVRLPTSSRAVSLSKNDRNRNSRMTRPKSLTSSPKILENRTTPLDRDDRLTKEQEKKLTLSIRRLRKAVRVRDTLVEELDRIPTESEWAEAFDSSVLNLRRVMYDGQQARTLLVTFNAGLVISIAKRHFRALKQATEAGGGVGTILSLQDLIQEGNVGLMQAAERFEAERGHRFSTYGTYWIRQRILRAISDSSRTIRLPAHVHSMNQKISKAKKEMAQQTGQTPSLIELAHYMEITVDELEKHTSRTRNVVSLESPLRRGGGIKEDRRTIGDLLMSDAPTPEEAAYRMHLNDAIQAVIKELADAERDVLVLRFGLEKGEPLSVSLTAQELGFSPDKVRSLEARALNKLRSPQRNYRLKEYIGGQIEEEQVVEEKTPSREKIWFF